jgi:anthranilate 1,2-dioxygenase small subunit
MTDLHRLIENFLVDYAQCLDDGRFAEWPGFFDPAHCRYEILSRENVDLGLPAPILSCYSHGMLVDRVTMLVKQTLTYRPMYLRRQITNVRVRLAGADMAVVRANLVVYQSDMEGVSSLYMVGRSEDEILVANERPLLRRKTIILDSFGVDTMLAVPL